MGKINIDTTQNVAIEHRIASVGERILATLVDSLIIFSYIITVSYALDGLKIYFYNPIAYILIFFLPISLYHLLSEIFMHGQSLGKKVFKIKVIKIDGAQPSLGSYFIRWIFRLIDIVLGAGSIATVTVLINGKGQRMGDIVAKTTVVSTHSKSNIYDTILTESENNYEVQYPEVKLLNDKDITTAKEVLSYYYRNINKPIAIDLLQKTQLAISSKMGVNPKATPGEFLKTVLKDYTATYKLEE